MVICSGSDREELHRENSSKTSYANVEITAASFYSWIFAKIPGLSHCFPQHVQGVIQRASISLDVAVQTPLQKEVHSSDAAGLLNSGTAWAIVLSIRAPLGGECLMESFMSVSHSSILPDLIYRFVIELLFMSNGRHLYSTSLVWDLSQKGLLVFIMLICFMPCGFAIKFYFYLKLFYCD